MPSPARLLRFLRRRPTWCCPMLVFKSSLWKTIQTIQTIQTSSQIVVQSSQIIVSQVISDDLHRLATLHIAPKAPLIIEQTTTLDHVFWSLRFSWIAQNGVCYHETNTNGIWIYWRAFKRVKEGCEELRKVQYQNAASSHRCGMLWQVKNIHKSSLAADVLNCFYIYISLYIIIYI